MDIETGDIKDRNKLKFGPLAISEIDQNISAFEADGIDGILAMMKVEGMKRLKHILKVLQL